MELLWLVVGAAIFAGGVWTGAKLSSGRFLPKPQYPVPLPPKRPDLTPQDIVSMSLGDPSVLQEPPPNGTVRTKPGFSPEELKKAERQMAQGKGGFTR